MSLDRMQDIDSIETQEWLDALDGVLENEGVERAHYLMERLIDKARRSGAYLPYTATTAYINTIPPSKEPTYPGDKAIEARIRSIIRWNALAIVLRASKKDLELGGHIASFASSATLYDVGFNHFFKGDEGQGGDLVYIQGHASPGIYARAFMEGRFNEEQLSHFRQEVDGKGISSYPHPWLMPDFWQFPTVSMGLGPIQAIYQARFLKYLENRDLQKTDGRKVWAFMGDGEMDEPESMGAIGMAGREKLDNLIFVVNCNLQRLDGPVRGNGKIIQELEADFRGAGWNVIKVIWGRYWDPLLARDTTGALLRIMEQTVDGEYQNCKSFGGAYTRKHFFGKDPETAAMVANMTDTDIWRLNRGGHDPSKVYAAYHQAVNHKGAPTVILAKTVKGYGMGESGEGKNIAHQVKKLDIEAIKHFRNRFRVPIPDDQLENLPFYLPPEDSPEMKYLRERRKSLGGFLPARRPKSESLEVPELKAFEAVTNGSGDREISTTMAFVRLLNVLMKDKKIGNRIVPIIPDEARTFGMEGMFRTYGIYSSVGQLYDPVDADQVAYYKEDRKGQLLEEGINEAGAMSSWIAAGTSYSSNNYPMIPFYIFYSMFGLQRTMDLAWAAGDMQTRGFLLGATAGRTTLNGEGLQHEDGHSHVLASTIPSCVAYDPAFGAELAVIVQDGLRRMVENQENVFYYITLMNENYQQPALKKGSEEGILKGMYLFNEVDVAVKGKGKKAPKVQLFGSGTIMTEVMAAAELLRDNHGVSSDIWSVTSYTELRRDGLDCDRHNLLHVDKDERVPYVTQMLKDRDGPVIAASDYMKSLPDLIRQWVPTNYRVLGTDGYGRSDSRANLRRFFEVDRYFITVAALKSLAEKGDVPSKAVKDAITLYGIDVNKPNPVTV
ncbi:pyruvate dehydrogenase (acetyl-transferring), homodimeric type [Permianibacter aggregans]|uniref:Pyruvate dehydrogenase E1 component n=2 Tax=Permianibacter aggregans TaxID=1510150 RepID=A0A4R6UMH0_9GAMM|nr:pyruvate dehydrogenase (acetyl-transferring), homodimeric type [Permianibacter aggregans]TDQ46749.1 pyruvate dehydrogenase E1 component [Permianibacter aggregans]